MILEHHLQNIPTHHPQYVAQHCIESTRETHVRNRHQKRAQILCWPLLRCPGRSYTHIATQHDNFTLGSFGAGASWGVCSHAGGVSGRSGSPRERVLGRLGGPLVHFGRLLGALGRSWGAWGGLLGTLGSSWDGLGLFLGRSWASLGDSWPSPGGEIIRRSQGPS